MTTETVRVTEPASSGQTRDIAFETDAGGRLRQTVSIGDAPTAAVTSVAASTSAVTVLASNTGRKGAMFFNDSSAAMYLKLGSGASTSSFTVKIAADGYYELPEGAVYTGAVTAVWASATGNVRVTELS